MPYWRPLAAAGAIPACLRRSSQGDWRGAHKRDSTIAVDAAKRRLLAGHRCRSYPLAVGRHWCMPHALESAALCGTRKHDDGLPRQEFARQVPAGIRCAARRTRRSASRASATFVACRMAPARPRTLAQSPTRHGSGTLNQGLVGRASFARAAGVHIGGLYEYQAALERRRPPSPTRLSAHSAPFRSGFSNVHQSK